MLRTGTVQACEGGELVVQFERPEACKECGACGGTRHGHQVRLKGEGAVGDLVTVEMPESRVVFASALAYALPLVFLLAGLLIGASVAKRGTSNVSNDLLAALGALGGLAISMPILWLVDRTIREKKHWTPQIVAIVPAQAGQEDGQRI